jgi:DNA-binding LacI/PurR family transcriptional regulator
VVLFPYSPSKPYVGWGSEYVSTILSGVDEALSQSTTGFTVAGMGESGELPDCIRNGSVSGVIAASHQQLPSLNVPVVGAFLPLTSSDHDLVVCDHEALGTAAAHQLRNAGCRTCAFVNPLSPHAGFALRKRGFSEALLEDDIDVLAFEADYQGDPSTIEALVRNVLDHDNKIDGIFIPGSDSHVAAIAMELAKQSGKPLAGLTVVSSISNIELLGPMNLGIDYIDIRLHDIGSAVATTLLWRIQNPTAAYRKIMIQPLVLVKG